MLLACVRTAITQPLQSPDLDGLPFQPTYLFTANVSLGLPPQEIGKSPITIPGGVIVPEQILGGTISGPFLNATIVTGLATPQVYLNGTLQQPVINLYGVTTDGHPFSLHEEGIGSPNAQVTRIVSTVSDAKLCRYAANTIQLEYPDWGRGTI